MSYRTSLGAAFVALSALSASTSAQTLWGIEGGAASYGEFNAPPPLCPGAAPPYAINLPPASVCPTLTPFAPGTCVGGTAVDNNGNIASGFTPIVINSDGINLTMTTPGGGYVTSGPVGGGAVLAGMITGVACDGAADIYYISDGFSYAGVGIPPGPAACAPPPLLVGPFPNPIPGIICGLGFDPCTGTLWMCDPTGRVTNLAIGGAVVGGFAASPPLAPTLSGLTVDTANRSIVVTDGTGIAAFTPTGALVAPTPFYLSANPYPAPLWAATLDGLGFSLRPQNYGTNCSPGGFSPTIGWAGGHTWAGNPTFTITQTGAEPIALSYLFVSFGYSCPPIPFGCGGIWLAAPFYTILPVGFTSATGSITLPAALPAPAPAPCGIPVGVPLFFQFANFGTSGMELSDALSLTIGAL
jgi:hypothetical protein